MALKPAEYIHKEKNIKKKDGAYISKHFWR